MPLSDLPLPQLSAYTSAVQEPGDFRDFWDSTLREERARPLAVTFEPVENHLQVIDTFDVTFAGFGGAPIKAWLHLPANLPADAALPAVVQYAGYSGGRGLVNQDTRWAQAGYAHLLMDTRGQGYGVHAGDTADPHPSAGEVAYAGQMTRGISSKDTYYYRRVFVDAFRAVEAVQAHPAVDASRIILSGGSQGGGMTLAVAGLAPGRLPGVIAALPDVPFLQDFPRSVDLASRGPYPEVAGFLARHRDREDHVLAVLNYFDGVHLGKYAQVPALFSVALMDDICPPSTVFAAYNAYGTASSQPGAGPGGISAGSATHAAKEIEVYRYNNHEGGQEHQWIKQLCYVRDLLAS
jgi:cephalosporin-C deacetylase